MSRFINFEINERIMERHLGPFGSNLIKYYPIILIGLLLFVVSEIIEPNIRYQITYYVDLFKTKVKNKMNTS